MDKQCPRCKSSRITTGSVLSQTDFFPYTLYFRPKGLKPFTLTGTDVGFKNRCASCLDCGLVWSEVSGEKVESVIKSKGTDATKQKFGVKTEE